jgi:hypothetical protein
MDVLRKTTGDGTLVVFGGSARTHTLKGLDDEWRLAAFVEAAA